MAGAPGRLEPGVVGRLDDGQAHLFYGRAIATWWDVVAGVRQDVPAWSAQTWRTSASRALAPYCFEVEVGAAGRTHVRLETAYELLLTNRLVLQPLVEAEIYGKADPERDIGARLSTVEAGCACAMSSGVSWRRISA
jgi:copper resistance protein B